MAGSSYANLPAGTMTGRRSASGAWRLTGRRDSLSPRFLFFLLALFLVPVAFVPATRGFFVHIPPLPQAWWTVYLILLFGAVTLTVRWLGFAQRIARPTRLYLVIPFALLGLWQMVSVLWNGQPVAVRLYSCMQSLAMCSAVLGAVWLCSGLSLEARIRLGTRLTMLIGAIVFVYGGLSFVFPSLRPSSTWMDRTAEGLGFVRIFGPLGRSTTLNFAILPALGFSFGMVFLRPGKRALWILLTLFFTSCILATGSRGGILCLATFGMLLLIWGRSRAVLVLIPIALFLATVVAATGVPERFKSLGDSARLRTYETALYAYSSSPRNVLLGAGHGALYTKLHDDSVRKSMAEDRWLLLDHYSEYGYTLRNSHSAILRSLVETGWPGLLCTLVPLAWLLFRPASRSFRGVAQPYRMFLRSALAGCVALVPYLFFEEFFISAFWIVCIWTVYAVLAAEGAGYVTVRNNAAPRGGHRSALRRAP